MLDLFKSSFRNLVRKRLRTLLTVSGIVIGIASVIIIGAIGESGKYAVSTELDSMGIGGLSITANTEGESNKRLNLEDLQAIRSIPDVEQAMPITMQYTDTSIREKRSSSVILGIDSGANQAISLNLLYGRMISRSDVSSSSNVCMIDQNYAKTAYGRENIVGKELLVLHSGAFESYTIIGIVEAGSSILQNVIGNYAPNFVYVPYTSFQNVSGQIVFDQIAVRVNDNQDVDRASTALIQALERYSGETGVYRADNLSKQRDKLSSLLDIVSMILSAIGAISLVVAGLGIMTVMLVSVNERTREIGIRKAIGAKNRTILIEFLFEALSMSLIGSILGSIIGVSLILLAALIFGIPLIISMQSILVAIVFAVIIGVIFGVYPAFKASKLHPVDALRFE